MPEVKTKLWDSVFKTDPAQTKAFRRAGGFSGTAIKPLYLIHKATELWGSIGDAWGVETAEHVISGNTVFVKARLWYPGKEGKAWVEHWGGDVLLKDIKGELKPNDEAFKMAFTDATGKCLVQLGFSADVHMGLFDDSKYLEERKTESAAAANRRFDSFKNGLLSSKAPSAYWVLNQRIVDECRDFPESELAMSTILIIAKDAVKNIIMGSDDPAEAWGDEMFLINQIKEFPGLDAAYKELVAAGSKRKNELQQERDFKERA